MGRTNRPFWIWVVLAAAATATARAQAPASAGSRPPQPNQAAGRVIGTHLIDRYEAIQQVRQALARDPNNLNDWIILGELAQEVAADVPANLSAGYHKLAREAYESALKLKPDDPNLKAAAQFAREQEQRAEHFAQARRQAAGAYLAARRRELAQPGAGPTVRRYFGPSGNTAGGYSYQPFAAPGGQPYTYQQYSSSSYSPADVPVEANHSVGATERGALVKPAAAAAPP
jgi:tetratricopeptide (TPR) repeat protein